MTAKFPELMAKRAFICDMDGVIYHGNNLLPTVPKFVDWLNKNEKQYLFFVQAKCEDDHTRVALFLKNGY